MKLADIFCDNIILQYGVQTSVFGSGVGIGYVEIGGIKTDITCENGKFFAYIPPFPYGGPYEMKVVLDGEEKVIHNVLFGNVYIAAGQSNMGFPLERCKDIDAIDCDCIRYFNEPHDFDDACRPIYKNNGWQISTDNKALSFSAIAYGFAKRLFSETGIPVGIIGCEKGATRIDAWTDPDIVETTEYQKMIEQKHIDYRLYKFNHDGLMYKNKSLNIVPYTNSGVLWYQGESNRLHAEGIYYDRMLKILIDNWRNLWGSNLPFYCIQLMPFREGNHADWAIIREMQEKVTKEVENTYLMTLVQTGDSENIHPEHKRVVSEELANAVLNVQFGRNIEYCGPVLEKYVVNGNEAILTFSHADGLNFKGEKPTELYVIDHDDVKHIPQCLISGNTLKLTWEQGIDINQIQMGYSNDPKHNLYNNSYYLASPFNIKI